MIDFDVIQTAISNMISGAIEYVPNLLTAIFVLLIGWVIGRFVTAIFKRVAERIGLNRIVERTGVGEAMAKAEIKRSPTDLVAVLLFWIIFLNFLLIGLESLGLEAAVEPMRNLISFLPQLLISLATLVVGILIAQFIGRAAQAAMAGMGVEFHQQLGQGVNALLLIMVVIVVLEQLGIDASIMSNIFINVITVIVAGMALAFAIGGREVTRNVLAGYYAREQFAPGDTIYVDGEEGVLDGIGTMNAEIIVGEDRIVVPNTYLTETNIRAKGIAYDDPATVEE